MPFPPSPLPLPAVFTGQFSERARASGHAPQLWRGATSLFILTLTTYIVLLPFYFLEGLKTQEHVTSNIFSTATLTYRNWQNF